MLSIVSALFHKPQSKQESRDANFSSVYFKIQKQGLIEMTTARLIFGLVDIGMGAKDVSALRHQSAHDGCTRLQMEHARGLPCLTSPALSRPATQSEMECPRKRRLLQHIPFAWLMAAKTQGYQLEPKLGSEWVSPSASSLLPG